MALTAHQWVNLENETVTAGRLLFGQGGSFIRYLLGGNDAVLRLEALPGHVPEIRALDGTTYLRTSLAGTQGFSKTGSGSLVLELNNANAASYSYTGPTSLSGGAVTLQMNYARFAGGGARYFDPLSSLTLGGIDGGTTFTLAAGAFSGAVQTVNGLQLEKGFSSIGVTSTGSPVAQMNLGAISGNRGILSVRSANVYTTTSDANGFISGRVLYNGGHWAKTDSNGMIVSMTEDDYSATWAPGNHTKITATIDYSSGSTPMVTQTLWVEAASVVTLANALNVIESGGITFRDGGNVKTLTGGSLTAGTGVSSLLLYGVNGKTLNVNSNIVDNGAALNLEVHGVTSAGAMILGGDNTFSGDVYLYGLGTTFAKRNALGYTSRIEGLPASGHLSLAFGGVLTESYFVDADHLAITGAINMQARTNAGAGGAMSVFFLGKQDYTGSFETMGNIGGAFVFVDNLADIGETSALGAGSQIRIATPGGYNSMLRYIGKGNASTDRQLTISMGNGNIRLDNSSADDGNLTFGGALTLNITATGDLGVLRLAGTSTGTATLEGALYDTTPGTSRTSIQVDTMGQWVLNGVNTYSGDTTVETGTLRATQIGGTPFGSGSLILRGGRLAISPNDTASGDLQYTGVHRVAASKIAYSGGSTIELARGTANSLTYTAGHASAANPVLEREGQGTLIISTTSRTSLGASERFILNGTVPALSNGMASASLIGQDRSSSTLDGFFLTYDNTNGFQTATPTHTDFSGVNANSLVEITAAQGAVHTPLSLHALSANSASNLVFTDKLTLGSGGLILNGATMEVADLDFATSQGLIYTSAEGGRLQGSIAGSAGVVFFGPGVVTLRGSGDVDNPESTHTANYFNGGLVNIAHERALGATNATLTFNGGGLQIAKDLTIDRALTLNLGGGTLDVEANQRLILSARTLGVGSLIKSNAGTLVMNSALVGHSGDTIVTGGVLRVGDTTANSNAILYSFATNNNIKEVSIRQGGALAGHGTVNRSVNVYQGGEVGSSLGSLDGVNGVLTLSGSNAVFHEGSTLVFTLGGLQDNTDGAAGVDWDLLRFSHTSDVRMAFLNGSQVRLELGTFLPDASETFWTTNHTWTIAEATGNAIFENFGLSVLNGDFSAGHFYLTSTDKAIELHFEAIPEPGTWAMFAAGIGLLGWRSRRRQKKMPRF